MVGILDTYLKAYGLTRYKLAKESATDQSTWFHINRKSTDRWTIGQLRILAKHTGVTPIVALQELEKIEKKLGVQ